jgi:hypothetical protein
VYVRNGIKTKLYPCVHFFEVQSVYECNILGIYDANSLFNLTLDSNNYIHTMLQPSNCDLDLSILCLITIGLSRVSRDPHQPQCHRSNRRHLRFFHQLRSKWIFFRLLSQSELHPKSYHIFLINHSPSSILASDLNAHHCLIKPHQLSSLEPKIQVKIQYFS